MGNRLAGFIEPDAHTFFVATKAHHGFKPRPFKPAPLFKRFIEACVEKKIVY